jgi:hypothetical protein
MREKPFFCVLSRLEAQNYLSRVLDNEKLFGCHRSPILWHFGLLWAFFGAKWLKTLLLWLVEKGVSRPPI